MLTKLLQKLEDPTRPILGPNVKALKFWGLILPENVILRTFYMTMHILTILFTITEYIEIAVIKNDLNLLLTNVKITLLATVSCCKVCSFLIWQRSWKDIIDFITRADIKSRQSRDKGDKAIILAYTRYSRVITYFYWGLMTMTDLVVILQPMHKYFANAEYRGSVRNGSQPLEQVVSSWVPFGKTTVKGFLGASAFQVFGAVYGAGWITSFDTNAIVTLVFFRGELQLLRRSCARIFCDNDERKSLARIRECFRRRNELYKFMYLYNSCLSPIMCLYMVVCSIMLCASVFQMTTEKSPMSILINAEYVVFGVTQLFIYCWHGNDVTYTSNDLRTGVYESGWYSRRAHRKEVLLLLGLMSRPVVFSAGPFLYLTVPTFINIIKGAYSYYTLLK